MEGPHLDGRVRRYFQLFLFSFCFLWFIYSNLNQKAKKRLPAAVVRSLKQLTIGRGRRRLKATRIDAPRIPDWPT